MRFGWKENATPIKKKPITTLAAPKVEQEKRNGAKRPKAGRVCAAVWAWLDAHPAATLKEVKSVAPPALERKQYRL